jgi:hypothetical protein
MLTSSYIRCDVTDAIDLAQVRVNADWMFILCVMLEDSDHVGQLPALQQDSAVSWMTKESSHQFVTGKSPQSSAKVSDVWGQPSLQFSPYWG